MADITRARCAYPVPADALWRAITGPEPLGRWLGSCEGLRLEEGAAFTLQLPSRPWFDGTIDAVVQHVDLGRTWQMSWSNPALSGPTRVRLSAISTPEGSRLEITHSGFKGAGLKMKLLHLAGWNKVLRVDLRRLLIG